MDWQSQLGQGGGGSGGPVSSSATSGVSFGSPDGGGTHTDLATVAGFLLVAVIAVAALFVLRK
jgi:hypothetical protein